MLRIKQLNMDTNEFNTYLEITPTHTLFIEYLDRHQNKNASETIFTLMRDIATVHMKFYDYTMSNYVYENLSKKSLDKLGNVIERLNNINYKDYFNGK